MRVQITRPIWLNIGILGLSVASVTGCKSMPAPPGLGWLGWWGDSRPTASSLSATPPAKPSVANLPAPSASTGGYSQYGGQGTSLASYPSGSGVSQPPSGQAPGGYNVGPYAMSGANNSHAAHAPAGAGNAASSYGNGFGAAGAHAAQTPAYGGYQSPYAAGAGTGGAAPRTADSRSVYGTGENNAKLNPYATQSNAAPPSGNWNDDQRSQQSGGFGSSSQGGANDVNAQLPRGYTGSPAGYSSGGGSWTPADSSGAQASPLDRYDAGTSTASPAPRREGAFRPGSTGRNGGALPSGGGAAAPSQSQPLSGGAGYGSTYPSTSYPSTGYPSLGAPERTANGSDYAYPSMPQMR